jgi:hypothetical protein
MTPETARPRPALRLCATCHETIAAAGRGHKRAASSEQAETYDQLKKDGYSVAVVQNPTLSLAGDVAATKRVIDAGLGRPPVGLLRPFPVSVSAIPLVLPGGSAAGG